jgi:hypothetical protein
MRVRTFAKAKRYRDGGAVTRDDIASPPVLADVTTPEADAVDVSPEPEDASQAHAMAEASRAFMKQLEALKNAESLRDKKANIEQIGASIQPKQQTRAEKLRLWKTQGLSDREEDFLIEHPNLIDDPALLQTLSMEAEKRGIPRNTDEFFEVVKSGASQHRRVSEPTEAAVSPKPRPSLAVPSPRLQNDSASIVSAPVSRDSGSYSYSGGQSGRTLSSIRLTPAQKEAAKFSGVDEVTYARNLIRLREEKESDPQKYGGGH